MKLIAKAGLLLTLALVLTATASKAATDLFIYNPAMGGSWEESNFSVCGAPGTQDFQVACTPCEWIVGPPCTGGFGANPFRFTIRLFHDGTEIGYHQVTTPNTWVVNQFLGVPAPVGDYYATVKFERRVFPGIWTTVSTSNTPHRYGVLSPSVTAYNINGTAAVDGADIGIVCASNVTMNAANTSCETSYFIEVLECNVAHNPTGDYYWAKWFSGEAPNGINLQQYCTLYSYPPYYAGDPARQGSPMIAGTLARGLPRLYKVKLATIEPTWHEISVYLQIDGGCREGAWSIAGIEASPNAPETLAKATHPEHFPQVLLYPNPARTSIHLQLDAPIDSPAHLQWFDLQGRQLGNHMIVPEGTSAQTIELQRPDQITTGTYLLRIQMGSRQLTKRIVWE